LADRASRLNSYITITVTTELPQCTQHQVAQKRSVKLKVLTKQQRFLVKANLALMEALGSY